MSYVINPGAPCVASPPVIINSVGATSLNNFVSDGASFPWSWGDIVPPHIWVASTNTLWASHEGWQPIGGVNQRVPVVTTYNTTTGWRTSDYIAGTRTLVGDLHGVPDLCRDPTNGYVYLFYGAHTSVIKWARTTNPDDPTSWTDQPDIQAGPGAFVSATFPKCVVQGGKPYLFYASSPNTEGAWYVQVGTFQASGGIIWGAQKGLFDVSTGGTINAWVAPGEMVAAPNGTDIHFVFTISNPGGADSWQSVFYLIYQTGTGNITNYSGGTSIAPASQPANNATLQANFKIVDQSVGPTFGGDPSLFLTSGAAAHVLFLDGPGPVGATGGPYAIKHITAPAAGAFSAPFTVFTYAAGLDNFNASYVAVDDGSGGINAVYIDNTKDGAASGHGSVNLRNRSSTGTWGSASTIFAAGTKGIYSAVKIPGGPATARYAFTEASPNDVTIDGTLKGYIQGDSALLTRPSGWTIVLPAVRATTLNPSDKSANIGLTGGNLTATASATNVNGQVIRSTVSHSSGAFYFQAQATVINGAADMALGLCNASQPLDNTSIGFSGTNSVAYFSNGNVYLNSVNQLALSGGWALNDVISVAWRPDVKKVWFQQNQNGWNGASSTTQNPETNVGGIDISTMGAPTLFACLELDTSGDRFVASFGGRYVDDGPPANHSNW